MKRSFFVLHSLSSVAFVSVGYFDVSTDVHSPYNALCTPIF
jgi:hypothetical protein